MRTVPRIDDLLGRIRAQGGRVTTARRAVLTTLLEADGEHLSVEELAGRVKAAHPDLHLSTVYRTLDALEAAGLVLHVHLGHGPSTYHLAEDIHHHAVCANCGRVIHLPDDTFDQVGRRLRNELGFELAGHHFALSGRCADCVRALSE